MMHSGAYRVCGIVPGERMKRAYSTTSVISRDYIPSGKPDGNAVCGSKVRIWFQGLY